MIHCYKLQSKETDIFMEGLRNRFSSMIEKQPINDDTEPMGELQFKCPYKKTMRKASFRKGGGGVSEKKVKHRL